MIDMLMLSHEREISNETILSFKKKYNLHSQGISDKHYNNVQVLKKGEDRFITIKSKPRNYMSNILPKIQINPSYFKSHRDVLSIISDLGLYPKDLSLTRIDLNVDLHISLQSFNSCLRVKNKQIRADYYKGFLLRGVYFGQGNDIVVVYDKAFQLNKETLQFKGSSDYLDITRIEVRKKTNSLPFKTFDQLSNYIDLDPFKNLEVYDLSQFQAINQLQSGS